MDKGILDAGRRQGAESTLGVCEVTKGADLDEYLVIWAGLHWHWRWR